MPYPNEHAARILQPGIFEKESFRRKTISPGIIIIVGRLKNKDTLTTQAYRFLKENFTADQARKWLQDHNINPISFEAATNKGIQSFISLQGFSLNKYSEQQILSMIPVETLNKIKESDKNPFFQVYSICHPGISSPKILGDKSEPITWTKKAVQSIKNLVLKGVKLFKGHNSDNATTNRQELGEVVYNFEDEIEGEFHHLVITYHKPEIKEEARKNDICSQEAVWNLVKNARGYLAKNIENITGIALGQSNLETPAFAGARRLGMVQCFDKPKLPERSLENMGEENKQLSVAQIKAIIEERNIWPWQVFTEEQIRNDRQYGKAYHEIDNLKKEVEQLKTAHTEKEKTIKEYGEKEKNLQLATYRQNAKDRSKRMLQLQNATDAQIKFFELKFSPNEMNLEDLTDEALQKKINSVLAERQKLAAAGIIKDEQSLPPKDDKKGEQPKQPVDKNDLTKAENNELLTEDLT